MRTTASSNLATQRLLGVALFVLLCSCCCVSFASSAFTSSKQARRQSLHIIRDAIQRHRENLQARPAPSSSIPSMRFSQLLTRNGTGVTNDTTTTTSTTTATTSNSTTNSTTPSATRVIVLSAYPEDTILQEFLRRVVEIENNVLSEGHLYSREEKVAAYMSLLNNYTRTIAEVENFLDVNIEAKRDALDDLREAYSTEEANTLRIKYLKLEAQIMEDETDDETMAFSKFVGNNNVTNLDKLLFGLQEINGTSFDQERLLVRDLVSEASTTATVFLSKLNGTLGPLYKSSGFESLFPTNPPIAPAAYNDMQTSINNLKGQASTLRRSLTQNVAASSQLRKIAATQTDIASSLQTKFDENIAKITNLQTILDLAKVRLNEL